MSAAVASTSNSPFLCGMLRFILSRYAFFVVVLGALAGLAGRQVAQHGLAGAAGVAQWCCLVIFAALLVGGVAWARKRGGEVMPRSRVLWALLGLAAVSCWYAILFPMHPSAHLPLSIVVTMGCFCGLWALLRHCSLLFWCPFLALELMQREGYRMYGSRINSLVISETLEASMKETMGYLGSENMKLFLWSIAFSAIVCLALVLLLRRQRRLPLLNAAFACGAMGCLYSAALPPEPEWRLRDLYWPVMETRELGCAFQEAIFHNYETIRIAESLPSPEKEPSSLGTLQGGEGVVLVVHIGESVRADRMSVNGYARDTTPWIRRQPRLINFSHCISAACDTCQAQIAILTDARRDIYAREPELRAHTGSVLDLFVKHGFRMYSFFGLKHVAKLKYDRVGQLLTSRSAARFHAPGSPWSAVPQVQEALRSDDAHRNTLIFINNEGSHTPFDYFDRDNPPFVPVGYGFDAPASHAQEVNNAYDSTIHYTDEFVRRVTELLHGRPWVYLYISDHGEYLGDDGIWGRGGLGESNRDYHTTSGCVVGMFVLTSPEFEALHPHFAQALRTLASHADMPVGHEHIFHTLLGLFDLRSPWYSPELDLCSPHAAPYTGPMPDR